MSSHGGTGHNWSTDINNAWSPENPNSNVPRLDTGVDDEQRNSNRFLISSNYLCMNNITLGYTLPKKFVNKAHLQNVRFFVQATNLLFLSKSFSTWDPESLPDQPRGEDYPITKAITLGMQLNL